MINDEEFNQLRSRVLMLEGQVKNLYKSLNIEFVPKEHMEDDPVVVEMLNKGKELDAIKVYSQATNASLVEAKQAVEDIRRRLGI